MNPEERKAKIEVLRKHHSAFLDTLKHPYFTAKYPHTPEGKDGKHIGFYESELSKGDSVYIELCTTEYEPYDRQRTLYVLNHDADFKTKYTVKKDQYMIPVTELRLELMQIVGKVSTDLYTLETTETDTYVTKHYTEPDGSKHELTTKNGLTHEYVFKSKFGDGFQLKGYQLTQTIQFFKQLK